MSPPFALGLALRPCPPPPQLRSGRLAQADPTYPSRAEQALNQAIDQSPAGVLAALAQLGTTSADPALRQFALVLLRTLSLKSPPASLGSKSSSLVNALSNPHLNLVRAPLLTAFPTESDAAVRAKLASAVAGLAQAALDEKHLWAELGPVLLAMTRDSRADVRESVMRVWEDCPALVKEEDPNGVKGMWCFARAHSSRTLSSRRRLLKTFLSRSCS